MALLLEVLISDALHITTGIKTSVWKSREGFWPGWVCCEIRVPKQYYIHYLTWTLPETYLKILLHACSVIQSCLTLWDPMEYSPPGSSIHGIFQTRIREQVAISSSRGSSWTRRSNSCLLHLRHSQVDSLPLHHLRSPQVLLCVSKIRKLRLNRLSQCLAIPEWEQRSPCSRK